jgi:hypothetical protein
MSLFLTAIRRFSIGQGRGIATYRMSQIGYNAKYTSHEAENEWLTQMSRKQAGFANSTSYVHTKYIPCAEENKWLDQMSRKQAGLDSNISLVNNASVPIVVSVSEIPYPEELEWLNTMSKQHSEGN